MFKEFKKVGHFGCRHLHPSYTRQGVGVCVGSMMFANRLWSQYPGLNSSFITTYL